MKLPKGKWGVRCTEHSSYVRPRPHVQKIGDTIPDEVYEECHMTRTLFVGPDGSLVFSRIDALTTTKGIAMQVLELAQDENFSFPQVVKIEA